jgi:uncharacterized protein YkwD
VICLVAMAGNAPRDVAERVMEAVQAARREAGSPPLERRAELDRVARERARRTAALPHDQRLHASEGVGEELDRAEIDYRRVSLHLDMNRGYSDPVRGFVMSWSGYGESWGVLLSGGYDQVGIAGARADDGWIVLAAVLVESAPRRPPPAVPGELEARAVEAVNAERRARGLTALEIDPRLGEVARAHSRDMARKGYFSHVAPDGTNVQQRVRRRGLDFVRVGENLHKSVNYEDPVTVAVRSWLESPHHRELMLSPDFRLAGMGVAVNDAGVVHFTQVFLTQPGP